MQTALALLQDEVVAAEREDADRRAARLDARDPYDLDARRARFLDEVRVPELVLGERVDVCDGLAPERLREELDLVALDVLDEQDVEPLEERERHVVDGVAEDGLLDQKDVAVRLLDLLADIQEVRAAFLDHLVHLPIIVDDDCVVHLLSEPSLSTNHSRHRERTAYVGFGGAELELNEPNFCLLHTNRTASGDNHVLIEHEPVD